ncbi:MAG TPA: carbamoyltransferase HypF [Chloroflexota bacterium]
MSAAVDLERREISVRGIVQGVGFRPFIYALAQHCRLSGVVQNDAQGVHVEVEGPRERIELFLHRIEAEAPPLAVVEAVTWQSQAVRGESEFRIEASRPGAGKHALVSPDMATCAACLGELFESSDRRYRYPFTNCTNCGPRFTITRSIPYDRATTTMAAFSMCADCRKEYDDPANRRFHAQPNACPVCGPRVWLTDPAGCDIPTVGHDAIAHAAALLRAGAIVAIKGLGGYHLACDPFNASAVRALRARKAREDRPVALMAQNMDDIRALCRVTPAEEALLVSPARPIVVLARRDDAPGSGPSVDSEVAPRQTTLGMMLAYTPLHHLLLHDMGSPLVMTSGNRSSEPIAYRDAEAFEQLGEIADYFLVHDRPIHMRCDDSVLRIFPALSGDEPETHPQQARRSRGYAPAPLSVTQRFSVHTLACGGHLKNTFCLARDQHAFVSHHIGDLENYETLRSYREGITHYCNLFDVEPRLVACDLHPDYLSTQYAQELQDAGLELVGVQHHHAHIASCLADNQRPSTERVIGVAFDGTGYGTDGTLWGGEFFEGSIDDGFVRRVHLDYATLPGGEAAIRQPWRSAFAFLCGIYSQPELEDLPIPFLQQVDDRTLRLVQQVVAGDSGISWVAPQSSSAGRLFDTVAALVGVPGSLNTTYEGQAAIELELAAYGPTSYAYPFSLRPVGDGWVVETRELLRAVVEDQVTGTAVGEIAARFHRTMAEVVLTGCRHIGQAGGVRTVALSGGTFQNTLLVRQVAPLLREEGFSVYMHRRVPANDGGLSLGQAVLAHTVFHDGNR